MGRLTCDVDGCGRTISDQSRTGVCRNHMHYAGVCRCRQCQDPEFAERHRERNRERMKALHQDPEFAERNRERMKALHQDPEFAERHRERMKALNQDPEFAERNRERMKALNQDPEFAERNRERMKALHQDPNHNPLVLLSPSERADYDVLRGHGYTRPEALIAVGRPDILSRCG